MNAAIIYWSKGGNTEKAARAIREGLEAAGSLVTFRRAEEAADLDWFDYDLVCVGFPSYQWHPPDPMESYLKSRFAGYRQEGRIKPGSPRVRGKWALVFCTYSGVHTGIHEALPGGKYAGQFFDHLGFEVLDEWYLPGEFHGSVENSTQGRLGDVRGRPNEEDLRKVREDAARLVERIRLPAS